jgi:GH25 family lysozyme M1 (1,4-beta-N-acetylmuramidase)
MFTRRLMRRAPFLALLGFAACGCQAPPEEEERLGTAEEALDVCPAATVEGLDVSDWDGTIDWKQVAGSGRAFAFMKATQGDYFTANTFKNNWPNAKAAGLLRAAYHFFDPTVDGVAQAKHFLSVMGPLEPGDLPPMLDMECPTSSNQGSANANCESSGNSGWVQPAVLQQRVKDWLDYVEQQIGRKPMIYSYNYWFQDSGIGSSWLHAYPLVISYPTNNACYKVGLGNDFTSATFWQWSIPSVNDMNVPGVPNSGVDLDRFLGTLADLKQFAGGAPGLSQISGNEAMTLVNWPDGHPEIFVQTTGGDMLHAWANGTTDVWNGPEVLDSGATCGAAASFWSAPHNYAELFDGNAVGAPQHLWWTSGTWNTFVTADMSSTVRLSHFATLAWPDGHTEVTALGDDHAIWHTHLKLGVDPAWAPWESFGAGNFVTGASAIVSGDGHAELFATDADGAAWHNSSGNFPSGWQGWESLGGQLSSRPVPARWSDGHLEVFARGQDGQLYHSEFGGSWPAFSVLSPGSTIEGEPSVIVYDKYGPEVFARSDQGQVLHSWFQNGAYVQLTPLFDQKVVSDPFAWMRTDGRVEVFAIDAGGTLVRSYHQPTAWTPWAAIGGNGLNPCLPKPPGPMTTSASASSSAGSSSGAGAGGGPTGSVPPGAGNKDLPAGCHCRAARAPTDGSRATWALAVGLLVPLLRRRRGDSRARR